MHYPPAWMIAAVAFLMPVLSNSSPTVAQDTGGQQKTATTTAEKVPMLPIDQFAPQPKANLVVTELSRAKFPVIDIHSHFWVRLRHDTEQLRAFVELMDRNSIAVCVSLDGRLGMQLSEHIRFLWTDYRDRFAIFANLDWQGSGVADQPATWACNDSEFARRTVLELTAAKEQGVSGLKIFKSLGLEYRNADGSLIAIDDSRFAPVWQACGKLGLPILIHTADPSAFFDAITPENERYEELARHPEWHFPADRYPSRSSLYEARNRLLERHPDTNFIAAHFGNDAENLNEAAQWLDRYPNLYLDIASRISELGRQPYTSRDFLIKYQDRILFGTDGPWPEKRLQSYWRFLESSDEYFHYSEKPIPPQGLWRIYGIHLPDQVLQKIYYENALKLIPGLAERIEKYSANHSK